MSDSPDLAAPARGRNASQPRTRGWMWPVLGLLASLGGAMAYRSSDSLAGQARVRLRYAPPEACVWAYRVQIDERFADPGYGRFFNRAEEHSISWLGIRQKSESDNNRDAALPPSAQVRLVSQDAGVKPMRGATLTPQALVKDWEGNAQVQGPAAPDVACRDRSWDPLEDAMGLAFPRLPGHAVAVGESWEGAQVSGDGSTCSARDACCNLGACLNAEQARDREAPCVVGPWREQLLELKAETETETETETGGVAVIEGSWEDGRPGGQGARAHRRIRFELESALETTAGQTGGRLLDAQITLSHPFLGLTREIHVTRIDHCANPEPTAASTGPEDAAAGLARIEAAFEYKQPGGKAPGG